MPKISVILPSFNYEDLLPQAIDSVLTQTYSDWELVVVDDGSTDHAPEIIRTYVEKYPSRIKLFFHEGRVNKGLVETYKLGLSLCTGEYVAFIEADDIWRAENLEKKLEVFEKYSNVVVVHSALEMFGEERLVEAQKREYHWWEFPNAGIINTPFYAFPYLTNFNFVMTFSAFMARRTALQNIDFSVKYKAWLDWWILSQLSLQGKFYYLPEKHVAWRVHGANFNRAYRSQIDDYRASLRFKEEIAATMDSVWRQLKKKGNADPEMMFLLGQIIRKRARSRLFRKASDVLKGAIKVVLPDRPYRVLKWQFLKLIPHVSLRRLIGHVDSFIGESDAANFPRSFRGWFFAPDGSRITHAELWDGSRSLARLDYGFEREDVHQRYSRYQRSRFSGFFGSVLLPKDVKWPLFIMAWDDRGRRHKVFELRPGRSTGFPRNNEHSAVVSLRRDGEKMRILVLDDRIPAPDEGYGSPRIYAFLEALVSPETHVTFFPMKRTAARKPYTRVLRSKGVEVITDEKNFLKFTEKRVGFYDTVIVSRPHNFDPAHGIVRRFFPGARLIYDSEALFFLREELKQKFYGNNHSVSFDRMASHEIEMMKKSDGVIAVSEFEKAIILQKAPELSPATLVWGHALTPRPTQRSFEEREGLLFVGAFFLPESPNERAVLHFLETVLPLVQEELSIPFFIAGAGIPASIQKFASNDVKIPGFLPDLTEIYDRCRVFVVPHLYSAGIPIKLIEAMSRGVPAVVSSLTASQLSLEDGKEALVGHNPRDFAKKVVQLYKNPVLWNEIRANGLSHIKTHNDPGILRKTLRDYLKVTLEPNFVGHPN